MTLTFSHSDRQAPPRPCRILFVCLLLVVGQTALAQYAPWTISPTEVTHRVVVPAQAQGAVGPFPLADGDAIGGFCEREGQWVCCGYFFWDGNGTELILYGEEDGTDGFREGERIRFRIWRAEGACLAYDATATYAPAPTTADFVLGEFASGRTSVLASLNVQDLPAVVYPKNALCDGDGIVEPVFEDGRPVPSDMEFSVEKNGLALDPKTGQIDVNASQPGQYQVLVSHSDCLPRNFIDVLIHSRRDFSVTFKDPLCPGAEMRIRPHDEHAADFAEYLWEDGSTRPYLDVDAPGFYHLIATTHEGCPVDYAISVRDGGVNLFHLSFQATDATCETLGRVELENLSSVSGGASPYVYLLQGQELMHQFYSDDGVFEDVPADEYYLYAIEARGCRTLFSQTVLVEKPDNCEEAVLTPNGDGLADYIHIPFQGQCLIYDRSGRVFRRFQGPGRWDGRNDNGQIAPMGLYIVRCNGDWMRVTVVR